LKNNFCERLITKNKVNIDTHS